MSESIAKEQARKELLDIIRSYVDYWDKVDRLTTHEKLSGLAFSILGIFDGVTPEYPAIDLVLRPHPDDKEYHIDNEDDWYEDGMVINDDVHLHDDWHNREA